MAKDRKLSARRQQALDEQLKKERQQRLRIGGIAAAVVVVLVGLFLVSRSGAGGRPVGADGTAWGPADAPVVIEEWSDFD